MNKIKDGKLKKEKKIKLWEKIASLREGRKERKKNKKIAKMRLSVIILIGYRNILVNKFRSILTIGGVAVGIGIITFLICLGFGFQKMVIHEVTEDNPVEIISVDNGNLDNFVSLDNDSIEKIRKIEGVKDVERVVTAGGNVQFEESQSDVIIHGTTQKYFELAGIELTNGKINYENENEKVAVSNRLANLLGFDNPTDLLHKKINFNLILSGETNSQIKGEQSENNNEAEVIAIIQEDDYAVAYFSYSYFADTFDIDLAQSGKVRVGSDFDVEAIRVKIENMGFLTESVSDTVADINSFFVIIRAVLIIFGIIIMSISAMGMLNTLSVSLLQRTKEVGILKALGTKRKDIFKMFIFEAAIISFFGGLLGFLGGYTSAKLINFIFNTMAVRKGMEVVDFVHLPYYFIVAIIAFIAFLGLVTGIMPARRASKIHALDALRYE